MRALYSTAISTIAWLGEAGGNSDLVYSAMSASQLPVGYVRDTRQALATLLNRPYWWRVWVIQEFLLPLHLDVWWGGCRLEVHDFDQVVRIMAGASSGDKPRKPQYLSIWNTPGRNLLQFREIYWDQIRSNDVFSQILQGVMSLSSLLRSFSTSKCSLIHDRVYGLLGIASDTAHSTWPIVPDYRRSPKELLLDVLQSQRREESGSTGYTWQLIKVLCKTLELDADELFALAFRNAPKTEREIHMLICKLRTHDRYSSYGNLWKHDITKWDEKNVGCGYPDFYFVLKGILGRWRQGEGGVKSLRGSMCAIREEGLEMAVLESSVRSIKHNKGCLVALGEYLDSCPLAEPRIPSDSESIHALIEGLRNIKTTRPTGEISRWHTTNTFEVAKLLYSLGQQTFPLGHSQLVFMHKSLSVHTDTGRLSAISYNSFGRFGIAVLFEYGKDCAWDQSWYSRIICGPKIVGTAFFCKL